MEWKNYYKEWSAKDYDRHIQAWKGFCHRIRRYTPEGGNILEVGFGSGQMSIYMSKGGYRCIGIDIEPQNVMRAKRLNDKVGGSALFLWGDVFLDSFAPDSFDTSFSQGLLEHFEDEKILNIIEAQFNLSDVVAFSIPLDKYGRKNFGDERLLPVGHWKELISNYNILYFEEFAKGQQLMAIIERSKEDEL